jgi:dolichol-phosphate mannosyltransferase
MFDTLVIVPTYNEIENLTEITSRILAASDRVHILVVDDNSPDGTGKLADELAAATSRIRVLHRARKSGLGDAYRAGFAWGLDAGYEFLVEMDGDGSHRPEQLPDLLAAVDPASGRGADVVLGSRWVSGGGAPNWAMRRALLSRAGSFYARCALGLPYRDVTGGYRVFRASALERIDYATIQSQGYCFQIEMAWRAHEARLRIVEVPIQFAERENGTSKMSMGIVVEAVVRVSLWGVTGLPQRLTRGVQDAQPEAVSLELDGNDSDRAPLHGGTAPAHRIDGRG